jgi:hypothetical protein
LTPIANPAYSQGSLWLSVNDGYQRVLGKLNTEPSRTPAEGQRWVMVLRLV